MSSKENTKEINKITKFLNSPTSHNFISLFDELQTNPGKTNWQNIDLPIEETLEKLDFKHDSFKEFNNDLWDQLAHFSFEGVIYESSIADQINAIPGETTDESFKRMEEESKAKNQKEDDALDPNKSQKIQEVIRGWLRARESVEGPDLSLDENNCINRPLRFFTHFERIKNSIEPSIDNITYNTLSNKSKEFSNLLVSLLTNEKNKSLDRLDKLAGFYDKRTDFPTDSLNFLSPIILKFIYLGISKEEKIEIEKKIDIIYEFIFLKLFFGKFHHKILCQKYINKILEKLNLKKDLILFNNSYSSFSKDSNFLMGFYTWNNLSATFPINFNTIPQAAITLLLREMNYFSYENSLEKDGNYEIIGLCGVISLNIQNGCKNVSPKINHIIQDEMEREDLDKIATSLANLQHRFFGWDDGIKKSEKVDNIENKNTVNINDDTYVCPSLAHDIMTSWYEFDDYCKIYKKENEDNPIYTGYNIDTIVKSFLRLNEKEEYDYEINPFPLIYKDAIQFLHNFFPTDSFYSLIKEKQNIFCLPCWLEGYFSIFSSYSGDKKFYEYQKIFDKNIFVKSGLEDFYSLCFVINFNNMLFESLNKESKKIYFDIHKFKEDYKYMMNSKNLKHEQIFFHEILDYFIDEKVIEKFGILQKQFLKSLLLKSDKNLKNNFNSPLSRFNKCRWLENINKDIYEKLEGIKIYINNLDDNTKLNKDHLNNLNTYIHQMRLYIEELMPDRIKKLFDFINAQNYAEDKKDENIKNTKQSILKLLNMKSFKPYETGNYALGTIKYFLLNTSKLNVNDYKYKKVDSLMTKGLKTTFKNVCTLDHEIIRQFGRVVDIANASAHANKNDELIGDARYVIDFILNERQFGKIIKALNC